MQKTQSEWRALLAKSRPPADWYLQDDVPLCRHCEERPACRPNGLCWKCFANRGIRAKYPMEVKT